jgi:hypothetical protein
MSFAISRQREKWFFCPVDTFLDWGCIHLCVIVIYEELSNTYTGGWPHAVGRLMSIPAILVRLRAIAFGAGPRQLSISLARLVELPDCWVAKCLLMWSQMI